jgi:hypothetical protein
MTKAEFIQRVRSWAKSRYGLVLKAAWLDDLMKDDLVGTGERQTNHGIRPIYAYGCRSYRRAIQIARLRRDGFVGRDAIRIQLFLRGYAPAREAREALLREYIKSGKHILAQLRSRYVCNYQSIPNKQKARLIKSFGDADSRFISAGFGLGDDDIIRMMRIAIQEPISLDMTAPRERFREAATSGKMTFAGLAKLLAPTLAGTLMFDPDSRDQPEALDYIEKVITVSSDAEFEGARALFNFMTSPLACHFGDLINGETEPSRLAYRVIGEVAKLDGLWTAAVFVECLIASHALNIHINPDEIAKFFIGLNKQGTKLFDLIPKRVDG